MIGAMLAGAVAQDADLAASPYQLRYLGDPALTTVCTPLAALADLPTGLLDAMREVCQGRRRALHDPRPGLGLAANQVGATVRAIVARVADAQDLVTMLNPVLSRPSPEAEWGPDACLSIPGFQTSTQRHNWITVDYRDERWEPKRLDLVGLSARVVQHEVEHLEGRLIVDGLSRQQKRQAKRAVEAARR